MIPDTSKPAVHAGLEVSGIKDHGQDDNLWYNKKQERKFANGKVNQLGSEEAYLKYPLWKCAKNETFEVYPPFVQEKEWMQGVLYRNHTDENGAVQIRTRNIWRDVVWKGAF